MSTSCDVTLVKHCAPFDPNIKTVIDLGRSNDPHNHYQQDEDLPKNRPCGLFETFGTVDHGPQWMHGRILCSLQVFVNV